MIEKGATQAEAGRKFGLRASAVNTIVVEHPRVAAMLRRGTRVATVAKRFRLEESTVRRIATGQKVERTRAGSWTE